MSNGNNFNYMHCSTFSQRSDECGSDLCMLRSVGNGASKCILNLLETFDLGEKK